MRTSQLIVPTLALLAAGTPALAQAPAPDPLYHVEIIVFAYIDADRGEEDFRHRRDALPPAPAPRRYPLPDLEIESLRDFGIVLPGIDPNATLPLSPGDRLDLIVPEADAEATALALPPVAAQVPDGFRILRADELTLAAEAATLRRRAAYRVLGHFGWAQTGVEEERSVPVDLKHLGITNPTGTIKVWVTRFRHSFVDLEYFDGSGSFWSFPVDAGIAPLAYAQSYRLQEERNVLQQLEYIDHPLFGVLILITPAPAPVEPTGNDSTGGPAA